MYFQSQKINSKINLLCCLSAHKSFTTLLVYKVFFFFFGTKYVVGLAFSIFIAVLVSL